MKKERVLIISTIKNALLDTNVNASEAANVAYALRKEGFDVDILTFNPEDTINKQFYEIKDVNAEYDRIVTRIDKAIFYGGVMQPHIVQIYRLLKEWNKPIIQLCVDATPGIQMENLYEKFTNRKLRGTKDLECKIDYSFDDFRIGEKQPIIFVSQHEDPTIYYNITQNIKWKKFDKMLFTNFPNAKYTLYTQKFNEENMMNDREYDVAYYGFFRNGQRKAEIDRFINDTGMKNVWFATGKATIKSIRKSGLLGDNVTLEKGAPQNRIHEKINKAYATIVIGDKRYNNGQYTARVYETMSSNAVQFIDRNYDTEGKLYGKDNYRYVSTTEEFKKKVEEIKNNKWLREKLLKEQHNLFLSLLNERPYATFFEEIEKNIRIEKDGKLYKKNKRN